jgi:hypothetical protein
MFVWRMMWWTVKAVLTLAALIVGAFLFLFMFIAWVL